MSPGMVAPRAEDQERREAPPPACRKDDNSCRAAIGSTLGHAGSSESLDENE